MFGTYKMQGKPSDKYLVVSDTHFPYGHPDTFEFLRDIFSLHPNITHVIHVGDYVDQYAFSGWDKDPDMVHASSELEAARKDVAAFEELCGKRPILVTVGNHCMRIYRKAVGAGIPRSCLLSLNEIYDSRAEFYDEIVIKRKDEANIIVHHHGSNNLETTALGRGANLICGHLHYSHYVRYNSTPDHLLWSLQCACLIDKHSLAFAYSKAPVKRPIIGAAIVEFGKPWPIPMPLNSKGRYVSSKLVA